MIPKYSTIIVIPTYNAKTSIVRTINNVYKTCRNAYLVIVDDNSPDKTAAIVKKHFYSKKNITVINRNKKNGRGSAVIDGFKFGLLIKSANYFIEMDADLCHDPKYVPALVSACKTHDIVVASRYLDESKIIGWKLKRKLLSKFVNICLSILLPIPVTDYTNGYRCYTRKALIRLDFKKIKSKGFIVLSEMLYYAYRKKLRIGQIPFVFKTENQHSSNLGINEMKEAIFTVFRLKFFTK